MRTFTFGFLLIFGEEYGWRGFLLENLSRARGRLFAAVASGAAWALWHAPIVFFLARFSHLDNPWRVMQVQSMAVLVASMPFAHSYFLSRSIVPPMLFHFTWNLFNPAVLGDIYQNQAGIVVGNMLYINGEALAGIIAGLPYVVWFVYREKRKIRAGLDPA